MDTCSMVTCSLYILDPLQLLSQEDIRKACGICNNVDELYQKKVDSYVEFYKKMGAPGEPLSPGMLQLFRFEAESEANRIRVERQANTWSIIDSDLTTDSISKKAKKLARRLSRTGVNMEQIPIMYVTWDPDQKLVVAIFCGEQLEFMHVSDNSKLSLDHQCNAEHLCKLLNHPVCHEAEEYCNERAPVRALRLLSHLLGFSPE